MSTPAAVILFPEVEDREPRMANRRRNLKRLLTELSAVFAVKRLSRHTLHVIGAARSQRTEPQDLPLEDVEDKPLHDRCLHNAHLPVMRLPVEILTKVFHLVQCLNLPMPPDKEDMRDDWCWRHLHRWLRLRRVCRHWHDVVANTPSLWTDIHLHDKLAALALEPSHPAVFLSQSAQMPLTLYFGELSDFTAARHTLNVDEVLEQLPRVQEVVISSFCTFWDIVVNAIKHTQVPMLRSLAFTANWWKTWQPVLLSGDEMPALCSLSIAYCYTTVKLSNFRNLRQLDLRDLSGEGLFYLSFDLFSSMVHLEDLKLSHVCIRNPQKDSPPPNCQPFLPNLKRLVLYGTKTELNVQLLERLSLPAGFLLVLRGLDSEYCDSPTGIVNLTLQSKPFEKLLPLMTTVHIKFYAAFNGTDVSVCTVANSSLGMRCDFRASYYSLHPIPLLTQAHELWIDRWPSESERRAMWITYGYLFYDINKVVQLYCGGATLRCSRLFCHGDAYDGWLDGLTPNKGVSTPAPLLRELHILTPPPADPECQEKMAKMLEARRAAGIPLDTLCFYLPLKGFADHELAAWKEAFGQWGAWGTRTPGRLGARGSLKVVFVCTETLPRMRVPAFCTEPSAGLWKWPTMWDAY